MVTRWVRIVHLLAAPGIVSAKSDLLLGAPIRRGNAHATVLLERFEEICGADGERVIELFDTRVCRC